MQVASDRRHHHRATSSAAWVGGDPAEETLDDRRRSVLDPDREQSGVPVGADTHERWDQHVLDDVDDRRSLVDQTGRNAADCGFVAGHQGAVHAFGRTRRAIR